MELWRLQGEMARGVLGANAREVESRVRLEEARILSEMLTYIESLAAPAKAKQEEAQ